MDINVLDTPDRALLQQYANERDEAAFAELVRRHLPLVFSTAARKLGSHSFAEDVCQAVFVQLSKNARKLVDHPVLAGWLYITSSRLAAEFSRRQARRQKREEQAMQTDPDTDHANPEVEWSDLKPVLDLAMEELPEKDCYGIILRYFEGRDFSFVGRELGLSADAARMRVTRGLEQLRVVLKRHRITSTILALEVLLAEHSAEAVPAGLALSVASRSGCCRSRPRLRWHFLERNL
jgi:RNA polymerase sigma factor (sigma-70 family)